MTTKGKLLIVEDEFIIGESMKIKLERYGHEVCGLVSSGEAAILKAASERPDLVLMDIVLKGPIDGIAAAERIHSQFQIPVIYLTAFSNKDLLERAKVTEPFGYLIKPFKDRELFANIEMALYRTKMDAILRDIQAGLERQVEERTVQLRSANEELRRKIEERNHAEEQIHILTRQMITTRESERQRIARDLHDNIAQDLSAILIGSKMLFNNRKDIPQDIQNSISEFHLILQKAITSVRNLVYELHPSDLKQKGLVPVISEFCEEFSERYATQIDFQTQGMNRRFDYDIEINLYYIVREALSNIRKHAQADHIAISLSFDSAVIVLKIEDNGIGFDVNERMASAAAEKHMGIQSMEGRAGLLHGHMKIKSSPGHGTKIYIEVPCKK